MKNNSRPTIGFLTNYFGKNLINFAIWEGIYRGVKEADINMFCFPWNSLFSPAGFRARADALFTLVHRKRIDGLIIWGGGLWGNCTDEDLKMFFSRLHDFPIISIGPGMPGIPHIAIDNYSGMYDACTHIIEHHSCRRIVFLCGPESQQEGVVRFQAYKDSLEKYKIPFDPHLVVTGDFSRTSGTKSCNIIFDERKLTLDALIAANDFMAMGFFYGLASRGLKVPGDIKIAGFDDIEEGRYNRIPLTTVKQPFDQMGELAVIKILSLIRGQQIEEITTIPSQLIIRQSCGCKSPSILQSSVELINAVFEPGQGEVLLHKDTILSHIREEIKITSCIGEMDGSVIENLVDAIIKELNSNSKDLFITEITNILLNVNKTDDIMLLNNLISTLRHVIIPYIIKDANLVIKAENSWHQARFILSKYYQNSVKFEKVMKEYEQEILEDIYQKLIVTFKIDEFMKIVAENFPRLGIKDCYIALYENFSVSLGKSRLKLVYSENKCIDLSNKEIVYPSYKLIPDEFLPKNTGFIFIVELLYFENEQLGYLVFGDDFLLGHVYEVLRTQLGAVIKGAQLIEEKEKLLANLEEHAHNLQIMMNKLKHSNEELEQFFFIVSHDLKEPLRKILFFSNRLKKEFKNIKDAKNLDYLERLGKAVDRMRRLIENLLDYYRLTTKIKPFGNVNLSEIVEDILSDLEIVIELKKAVITVSDLPVIAGDPHQLQHLFLNLLTNSLKFFKPGQPPVIRIDYKIIKENNIDYCEITIEDNGIGIEPQYFEIIFGVFYRLHSHSEYEGTGIGLAICKKIVDKHNGFINVKSELGQGSQFIIKLPVKQVREDAAGETK